MPNLTSQNVTLFLLQIFIWLLFFKEIHKNVSIQRKVQIEKLKIGSSQHSHVLTTIWTFKKTYINSFLK